LHSPLLPWDKYVSQGGVCWGGGGAGTVEAIAETSYLVSCHADHFWFSNWNYGYPWHPHWRAPRCLPCHSDTNVSVLRMGMVKACPCTPQAMCELEDGYDNVLDKRKCTPPRSNPPSRTPQAMCELEDGYDGKLD